VAFGASRGGEPGSSIRPGPTPELQFTQKLAAYLRSDEIRCVVANCTAKRFGVLKKSPKSESTEARKPFHD
jgi:hypothetical protein